MEIVGYEVKLQVWYRRDGRHWITWTPALGVRTQSHTKKGALAGLREAVELWFESCIQRGSLEQALAELGLRKNSDSDALDSDNYVRVLRGPAPQPPGVSLHHGGKGRPDYIEGVLAAFIAADQLEQLTGAPS